MPRGLNPTRGSGFINELRAQDRERQRQHAGVNQYRRRSMKSVAKMAAAFSRNTMITKRSGTAGPAAASAAAGGEVAQTAAMQRLAGLWAKAGGTDVEVSTATDAGASAGATVDAGAGAGAGADVNANADAISDADTPAGGTAAGSLTQPAVRFGAAATAEGAQTAHSADGGGTSGDSAPSGNNYPSSTEVRRVSMTNAAAAELSLPRESTSPNAVDTVLDAIQRMPETVWPADMSDLDAEAERITKLAVTAPARQRTTGQPRKVMCCASSSTLGDVGMPITAPTPDCLSPARQPHRPQFASFAMRRMPSAHVQAVLEHMPRDRSFSVRTGLGGVDGADARRLSSPDASSPAAAAASVRHTTASGSQQMAALLSMQRQQVTALASLASVLKADRAKADEALSRVVETQFYQMAELHAEIADLRAKLEENNARMSCVMDGLVEAEYHALADSDGAVPVTPKDGMAGTATDESRVSVPFTALSARDPSMMVRPSPGALSSDDDDDDDSRQAVQPISGSDMVQMVRQGSGGRPPKSMNRRRSGDAPNLAAPTRLITTRDKRPSLSRSIAEASSPSMSRAASEAALSIVANDASMLGAVDSADPLHNQVASLAALSPSQRSLSGAFPVPHGAPATSSPLRRRDPPVRAQRDSSK